LPVPLLPISTTFSRRFPRAIVVLAAHQLPHQLPVDAGLGGEVEAVEGLDHGEAGGFGAALRGPARAIGGLLLHQPQQAGLVITALLPVAARRNAKQAVPEARRIR
jgi:hypothetical protein